MANLYHYTTGAGLLGMMKNYSEENKNLTMWATHYMYMNDPKEYIYGQDICLDIIDEIEKEMGIDEDNRIRKMVTTKEYKNAVKCIKRTPEGRNLNPFLISFSQMYDSLHMWDMYAQNGNGIAIQFNAEKVLQSRLNLKECIYHAETDNSIKQEIKALYKDLDKEFGNAKTTAEKAVRAHYISLIISLNKGVRIKHEAYEMEHEVRITPIDKDEVLFRDRKGLMIPYVEQQIPFECVENIIVGPTADFDRVCESIWLLMNSKGIEWKEDKIIKSKVPYRI